MMRVDAVNRIHDVYNAQMGMVAKNIEKAQSRDEVNLSNQAKDFVSIKKMIESEEQVNTAREKRIQELKEKIDNGTYNVTAEQVASKILSKINYRD